MPIYEYYCGKCGITYERLEKVDAPPSTECEECGEIADKVMSSCSYTIKRSQDAQQAHDFYKGEKDPKVRSKMRAKEAIRQLEECAKMDSSEKID